MSVADKLEKRQLSLRNFSESISTPVQVVYQHCLDPLLGTDGTTQVANANVNFLFNKCKLPEHWALFGRFLLDFISYELDSYSQKYQGLMLLHQVLCESVARKVPYVRDSLYPMILPILQSVVQANRLVKRPFKEVLNLLHQWKDAKILKQSTLQLFESQLHNSGIAEHELSAPDQEEMVTEALFGVNGKWYELEASLLKLAVEADSSYSQTRRVATSKMRQLSEDFTATQLDDDVNSLLSNFYDQSNRLKKAALTSAATWNCFSKECSEGDGGPQQLFG